jgi:hypothetical protein
MSSDRSARQTTLLKAALAECLPVLPAGLTSLLLARTGQVTGTIREVMAGLAVVAGSFDRGALARLCGGRSATFALLCGTWHRGLLHRSEETSGVQLRHALLAEAVAGDLLVDERRELHVRIAHLLAAWHGPAMAADIAEHFAAANRPSDELRWRAIAAREAEAK